MFNYFIQDWVKSAVTKRRCYSRDQNCLTIPVKIVVLQIYSVGLPPVTLSTFFNQFYIISVPISLLCASWKCGCLMFDLLEVIAKIASKKSWVEEKNERIFRSIGALL